MVRKRGDDLPVHLRERILHVLHVWEPRTSDQSAQHVEIFPDNQAASVTFIFPFPVSCLPTVSHVHLVCPSSNLDRRLPEQQVRSPRLSETLWAHKQQRILHPYNWIRGGLSTTARAYHILSMGIFSEDKNQCFSPLLQASQRLVAEARSV
jgi:hypothetical protein